MKINPDIFKKHRIIWHFLFWVCYLIFFTLQSSYGSNDYEISFLSYCLFMIVIIIAVYFNIYFLIPRYLLTKKYKIFTGLLIVSAIVFSFSQRFVVYHVIAPLIYTSPFKERYLSYSFFYPTYIVGNFVSIYTMVTLAAFIKLLKKWYEEQQLHQALLKEKLETEIKFLRAQIHPHFLFNTLNNLYSLALRKSDAAPEMILKLSSLLNYILYECGKETVSLEKEIDLINNYIELEKMRYGNRLNINFKISGSTNGINITPLILFPFIENSFKHGVSNDSDNPWISIDLKINEKNIFLKVENSKNAEKHIDRAGYTDGIGLKNVKRQLDLIYSNNYLLEINDNQNSFSVNFELNTNSDIDK